MMFTFLICVVFMKGFEIQNLDPQYQVAYQSVKIEDEDYLPNKYFAYGIWSRYNPLSTISQVGTVGLFNSNCFHLHNIVDIVNKEINLIYYDCLDYQAKEIIKEVKLVTDDDEQKVFNIKIGALEYENVWHFLEIIQNPFQRRFELLIISLQKIEIHSIDVMKYPFKGRNLKFTFGDGLIVSNTRIETLQMAQKFSYFPGKIQIQQFQIFDQPIDFDWFDHVKELFQESEFCTCQPNINFKIPDQNLNQQFKGESISQNTNCDTFVLQGWFRIQEIITDENEFVYPFLKLAANFENPNLTNNNLSPVQISYKLSDIQNQIIITTYSFTFPQVSIDFSNNPFLKVKTFDIINSIQLWHKIQIKMVQSQLEIYIQFYDNLSIQEYSYQLEVHQFSQVQFKIQFGNLQQMEKNYLQIQIQNFLFLNCGDNFLAQNCHYSCQECDGPTYKDCLSCSEESKRSYLPEHKVCVCPYDTIDNQICIGYVEANLQLVEEPFLNNECQYGYFELDNECIRCPSIIKHNFISCLNCIQNPKTFSQNPLCHDGLFLSQSNNTEKTTWYYPDQLLFNGIEFNLLLISDDLQYTLTNLNLLFKDFQFKQSNFISFCFGDYPQCYHQNDQSCIQIYISIVGQRCFACTSGYKLENGQCNLETLNLPEAYCNHPYYITSTNKCQLCPIQNCKQCFEYQNVDSDFKSTLYKNFENFDQDQAVKIGCAMCDQNFIFDFTVGICLKQKTKIISCLRSFINFDGTEICTLSSEPDFTIAPEIINCQKYYSNCLQCILTPQSKIQCVQCEYGYVSSIVTGNCYTTQEFWLFFRNSSSVIQVERNQKNVNILLIQSFMMLFLPHQYYYPSSQDLVEVSIMCKENYHLTTYLYCVSDCSSDCQHCQEAANNLICNTCLLNYYQKPQRVEENGQCISCSNLCEYCQVRNQEEIQEISSNFILQESNAQYTRKCIKPVDDPSIIINPYIQNAKYCFNKDCYNRFSFSYFFGSCIFDRYKPGSQDLDINVQYCNHVGTDQLTINFIFKIQFQTTCGFNIPLQIKSTLRNRIFSLKKLTMNLFSIYDDLLMVKYLTTITNFDLVQIYNINFKLEDGFAIQNNNQKVDVTLKNLKIIESNFQDLIIFQNQIFGDIQIFNLQIIDSTFLNSSFFNFSDSSKVQEIIIKNLLFINCIVNSSVLFNFKLNNIKIHIEEIVIKNCSILNSLIFSFEPGQNQVNQVNFIYMLGVEIIGCSFTSSNFFKTNNKFLLKASNLNFKNNYVKGSAIMAFNDNTELKYVKSNQNILKESTILSSLSVLNQSRVQLLIDEFEDNQSTFQESSLIIIHQSLQNDDYVVYLKNIKVWENKIDDTSHQQNQLFKLNCHYLQIQDSQFLNLKNVIVFTLFEIYQIIFESIQFENTHQQYKIPITKQCSNQVYQTNQLLKVVGFQYLSFSNIQIINQFGINFSIINIILSDQFNFNIIGQVKMINLLFKGNILLKDKQTTSVTLLSVNSQQNLNIQLIDFQFIQNFINQQVDEPLETQTGLLYLYSLDSTLQIHQLLCQQNTLTNSTTPFISLYAYLIEITNLNIFNQNILNQTLWQDFYDFQLDDQLNQDQMNLLIQSTFKILNQGILIVASSFSCTNSLFQNILGLKSFIFEIKTQGKGIIKINNLWANSISTNLQEQGSSGCINVISINSNLNLQLNEVKFSNIFHRMTSSLFTIEPSLKSNFILLNNVIIIDCISLMNTVMLIKFQTDVKQQSLVKINNMTIQQREESWINLFQKIGSFTQSEINDIKSDNNALILFENCRVELNNLKFNGIAISPILKFSNALQIKLIDCKFTNLQQFTSFNLIRIDQTLMMKQVITIQNLKIINSSLYQKYSIEIPILQEQNYKIVGCSLWKNSSISSDVLYSDILNQIYSSNQQSNSILFVQSIFESNSLFFQNLDIFGNNGSDFSNGVITFDVQNFSNFILENIHCYQNTVKENGCINIVIQNYINQTIRMKDSFFIQNKGSFGGAISIQNVKLKLTNCKIVSNKVSNFGGGMYLQLKDDDFQIKQTIITSNQALNGGGIYINKESNIKTNNLIQSFLLYNKATYFGDNLVESPHHLDLSINNKEMQSKKLIINKLHNQYLDLKPYSIIEQGIALYTIYLMIPSNQVIAKYQLYQPQGLKYFSYITSLGLKLKNSLNEQIQNYLNFTCILKNQIIYGDNLVEVGEESHQFLLEYDLQKEYC